MELRSKSGFTAAGLFGIVAVVTIALAAFGQKLGPTLSAGLVWVTLLFSSVVSLPKVFIGEEEAGTADLLRLLARPHAVFWGKALFNYFQMSITALVLTLFFFLLTNAEVARIDLYLLSLVGGCAALALAVTLSSALVARAASRTTLIGAIGLPILLPVAFMGVGSTRVALGQGTLASGYQTALGLFCYAIMLGAVGPYLFSAVWKD